MSDLDIDLVGLGVFVGSGVLPALGGAALVIRLLRRSDWPNIHGAAWVRAVLFVLITAVFSPIAAMVPDWMGDTAVTVCKERLAVDAQNRSVPDIEETRDIRPGNLLSWMNAWCERHLKDVGQTIPGRPVTSNR